MNGLNVRNIAYSIALLGVCSQAQAAISLSATRLVYEEKGNEASVNVRNHGSQEVLLQSWIEDGNKRARDIPFVVTPALGRLPGQGQQVLRVLYRGVGMPVDKESALWLNVQEIPQAAQSANTLQIAVRQRIKIFYRPKGLQGDANTAPAQLNWKMIRKGNETQLSVNNPSPYHVSMLTLDLKLSGQTETLDGRMLSPGETLTLPVTRIPPNSQPILVFRAINDWGGQVGYTTPVTFDAVHTARAIDGTESP